MTTSTRATRAGLGSRLAAGAVAGIAGGVVFGVVMALTDMLPMVGMLIGIESAFVGFLVHLANSAVIGAIFGVLAWNLAERAAPVLGAGLVYGAFWWVLGALILMPLWLSVTADAMMRDLVLVVGTDQWWSLVGHVLFGLVTAGVLVTLRRRTHA